jgi:hypothetical protein
VHSTDETVDHTAAHALPQRAMSDANDLTRRVGAFTDLLAKLDVDDRVKGKQVEQICKWFLTNEPG